MTVSRWSGLITSCREIQASTGQHLAFVTVLPLTPHPLCHTMGQGQQVQDFHFLASPQTIFEAVHRFRASACGWLWWWCCQAQVSGCLGVGGLSGRNINNNTINVVLARTRGNGTLLHPPPFVCIYNYYWE